MTTVSIVYHSGYGHTRKLAESVLDGIHQSPGVSATLFAIDANGDLPDEAWSALASSDAIVFGSPTYMGTVSWQFKKFVDATSKPWYAQAWKDKLFAGFTNSASMNGDKFNTIHTMMTLAMQHSGFWVGTGLMPSNRKSATRDDVNYLGSFSGLLGQSPSDASPDEGPPAGDLATGRLFGARIAEAAMRFATTATTATTAIDAIE